MQRAVIIPPHYKALYQIARVQKLTPINFISLQVNDADFMTGICSPSLSNLETFIPIRPRTRKNPFSPSEFGYRRSEIAQKWTAIPRIEYKRGIINHQWGRIFQLLVAYKRDQIWKLNVFRMVHLVVTCPTFCIISLG